MTTKTLYMVEYPGSWNGFPIGVERDVYDHHHEALEAAREHRDAVIYQVECRAVEQYKQGEGQ